MGSRTTPLLLKISIGVTALGFTLTVLMLAHEWPSDQIRDVRAAWRQALLPSPGTRLPIHRAADEGNLAEIKRLLEGNRSLLDAREENGETPLHRAARNGRAEVAEFLLSKGATKKNRNQAGETPLHAAAYAGSVSVAALLIAKGADVNAEDLNGGTPLRSAVTLGRADTVALLLDKGAKFDKRDPVGFGLLQAASAGGSYKIVKQLVAHGAKMDASVTPLDMPLHLAVMNGHSKVAELLFENGAPINARNREGFTPLHLAVGQRNEKLARYLVSHGAELDIYAASWLGELDRLLTLLRDDPSLVRATDEFNWTPLHWAAAGGRIPAIEILLGHNADVDAQLVTRDFMGRVSYGDSPLHAATLAKQEAAVSLLLAAGARANSKGTEDETPLHTAAREGRSDMVGLLIDHGADVNAEQNRCSRPLDIAIAQDQWDTAKRLIARGADVNANQPLLIALARGRQDWVELLLASGAKFPDGRRLDEPSIRASIQGNPRTTAELLVAQGISLDIYAAAAAGDVDRVQALLESDAILVNARDRWGASPLQYAVSAGQDATARLLLDHGAELPQIQQNQPDMRLDGGPRRDLLHKAVTHNDAELVTLLLSRGASVADRDNDRCTPLHKAAAQGCVEMVELLVDRGAEVNVQVEPSPFGAVRPARGFGGFPGGFGRVSSRQTRGRNRPAFFDTSLWTPLHFAAQGGHSAIAKFLLAHGANPNLVGERGQTPLHVAARLGRLDIVELLVAGGASVGSPGTELEFAL